jgi:multisubunit Na+/H+ antiporter MnhB subunit
MAVVLPMLAGYVAVAMQRLHRVVAFALAGSAVCYAFALTTLAVFTPDGGFSAQSGESPALAALDAVTRLRVTSWVPSAALDGQRVMFALWIAAAVGLGVAVWRLGRGRTVQAAGPDRKS